MFRNLANFLSPTSFRTLSKNNFVALMATLAAGWCCLLYSLKKMNMVLALFIQRINVASVGSVLVYSMIRER